MNEQRTVLSQNAILKKLFPQSTATFTNGNTEVNGLPTGTIPQNCEVIHTGKSYSKICKRQDYFLVRVDGVVLFT